MGSARISASRGNATALAQPVCAIVLTIRLNRASFSVTVSGDARGSPAEAGTGRTTGRQELDAVVERDLVVAAGRPDAVGAAFVGGRGVRRNDRVRRQPGRIGSLPGYDSGQGSGGETKKR